MWEGTSPGQRQGYQTPHEVLGLLVQRWGSDAPTENRPTSNGPDRLAEKVHDALGRERYPLHVPDVHARPDHVDPFTREDVLVKAMRPVEGPVE